MVARISKKWLILVLLTIPHLKPGYFEVVPWLDTSFNFLRILSLCLILAYAWITNLKISSITVVIIATQIYMLANTYLHHADVFGALKATFSIISMSILYDMFCDDKDNFVSSQLFCYELLIYANLLSELFFPNGLYTNASNKNWFLGYYNTHILYFIPGMVFSALNYLKTRKTFRSLVLIIAILLSTVLVWSGGSIVAISAMLLCFILFRRNTHMFNYFNYWLIQPIFFIGLLNNALLYQFKWFIDGWLHKWRSMTGRINVWNIELSRVKDEWLFGNGIETNLDRIKEYQGRWWAIHAHNLILELIHRGGMVYLFLFVVTVIMAGRKMWPNKDNIAIMILSIGFLGWSLRCTVDPYLFAMWIALFVLAYRSDSLFVDKTTEAPEKERIT